MKTSVPVLLGLSMVLLLASCSSPTSGPDRRRMSHPEWYGELSSDDQLLVTTGRIREGMTKNAVFLAWGDPDSVTTGSNRGKSLETWNYTVMRPHHHTSVGVGFGGGYSRGPWCDSYYGGYRGYAGPRVYQNVVYAEEPAATVTFESGKVVAWQARG